jgi:hypothetical protein
MDLLVFILPFLVGSAIIVALFTEYSLSRACLILTCCLGTGIGLGITSSTAFLWLVVFAHPGGNYLIAELCLSIFLVLFAIYRFRYAKNTIKIELASSHDSNIVKIEWLKIIFLILMIAFVASFILKAYFERPHGAHDAWAIWNYRARWLFRGGSQWTYAFSYLNAADSPDYPLLVTGSVFRMWSMLGTDHVAIPITVAGLLAVGSILIIFSSLAILRGENQGYLAAIFMFITTQFLNVSTYQYGDAPLAFFILGTIVLFSLKDHYPNLSFRLLFLAGLTASCAAWTKNEGVLFLVLIILIRFIGKMRRNNWFGILKQFLYFSLGMSFVLGTLIYFKIGFAIANDLVNKTNLKKLSDYLFDIDRYLEVLLGMTKKIFTFNDHIISLLIVYFLISGVDRYSFVKKGIASHVLLMLLMLGGYFFSYFISPHNIEWHMGSSLRRLIVQLWPTWVFLFFYCVKGPEKNASIPSNSARSF